MALLLDEIAEADPDMESIRALYMVTQNVHSLKLAHHDTNKTKEVWYWMKAAVWMITGYPAIAAWKEVIHISNRFGGGVHSDTIRFFVVENLEKIPPDVLRLLYRFGQDSDGGLR